MFGIILLILAIFLYTNKNKKWSLLILIGFCNFGFHLLTDNVLGVKNQDLTLIFCLVILMYSYFYERNLPIVVNPKINKTLKYFFLFLISAILISLIYYEYSVFQVIQGARRFFILFSYFFIRKTKIEDIKWIINKLVHINIILCIPYIFQAVTGIYMFPDSEACYSSDGIDAISRFYNSPPMLEFTLFLLLFSDKSYLKRWKSISILLLITALLCAQSRLSIMVVTSGVFICLLIRRNIGRTIKYGILVAILLVPFSGLIVERLDKGGETQSDLGAVLSGNVVQMAILGQTEGSFSFRLAILAERMMYLQERNILENCYGMGLITDRNPEIVDKKYHFQLGLIDRETGRVNQLESPDIAYVTLLCKLGYLGLILYMFYWFTMAWQLKKERYIDSIVFASFAAIFIVLLVTLNSNMVAMAEYSVFFSMLLVYKDKLANNFYQTSIRLTNDKNVTYN